jgi:hypothetical protein
MGLYVHIHTEKHACTVDCIPVDFGSSQPSVSSAPLPRRNWKVKMHISEDKK